MTHLLERINSPQDLHGLSDDELQGVAQEVREHIIDTVRVDRGLLKGGREVFGLRVHGDSMIEAAAFNIKTRRERGT